jgi:hypothetical protein
MAPIGAEETTGDDYALSCPCSVSAMRSRRGVLGGQPARVSNWDIHPVKAIDVCEFTTPASCKWDDEHVGTPLQVWIEEGDEN